MVVRGFGTGFGTNMISIYIGDDYTKARNSMVVAKESAIRGESFCVFRVTATTIQYVFFKEDGKVIYQDIDNVVEELLDRVDLKTHPFPTRLFSSKVIRKGLYFQIDKELLIRVRELRELYVMESI